MEPTTIRYTYEDYLSLPDNGKRHEIIEGELHMTPAPSVIHQRISLNIVMLLMPFVAGTRRGSVLYAPVDVVLSEEDVIQPDIVYVSKERSSIITQRNIHGAPDLVIEILSERTKTLDKKQKRQLYERHGVKEYWLVDPDERSVEVLSLGQGSYESLGVVRSGTIRSRLLSDFMTTVDAVFAV